MTRRSKLGLGVVAAVLIPLLGAGAPDGCVHGALYALDPESSFTQGCFPPCMCPIEMTQELAGSFALIERPSDAPGLFRDFDVRGVRWRVKRGDQVLAIAGSGHYRVGGEVAVMQQLELDLRIGGGPPQHFDSGLVPGGAEFPHLDVRVSVNGEFCYDTVLDVLATPLASTL